MDADQQLIEKIEEITRDLSAAFYRMKSIPGMYDNTIKRELAACESISRHLKSEIIKIAVVGVIKSGKSTFINSWLKKDVLKRGAGVVTSIVTRVRKGKSLKAVVALKSWDEINDEMEKNLLFFPDLKNLAALNDINFDINGKWFDLRRKKDRELLNQVKRQLCHANSVTKTGLRQEAVIINQALDGFESIKTKIQPESTELVFSGDNFDDYKEFTGNDSLAFFVKDVCLYVADSNLDFRIEIADCQGSDSTNPNHMVQIQEYLVSSSMIIYLVSSRCGIREADIKFLNIIRNMGLIDRVFFIVNLDIDEHVSLNDLIDVENRIKNDISYLKRNPSVFTFSSLYNLFFNSLNSSLSVKDKNRLKNWQQDTDLVSHSNRMTENFYSELNSTLTHERNLLLVANHVAHIRIMENNAEKKVDLFLQLLSENLTKAGTAVRNIKLMHERARKFDSTINTALELSIETLKSDIEKELHLFFDTPDGRVYKKIRQFILNFNFDYEKYELQFHKTGFNSTIYHMFHDFRAVFDSFMAETFTSEVAGFIKAQERKIDQCFRDVYSSNHFDPLSVFAEFTDLTKEFQIAPPEYGKSQPGKSELFEKKDSKSRKPAYDPVDLKSVKGIMGLAPPKPVFATKYSARIKFDSMAGFCFHFIAYLMSRVFKEKIRPSGFSGLKSAGTRIKKQTLQSVVLYLNEYSADLRSKYFVKLVPAVSRDFHDKLMDGFQIGDVEMEKIESLMAEEKWEKESQIQILGSIKSFLRKIYSKIDALLFYMKLL